MSASYSTKSKLDDYFAEVNQGKEDMQALIARGYDSLNAARYILLRITDSTLAKNYFRILIDTYITRARKSSWKAFTEKGDPKTAVHLAFTHSGLVQLGLPKAVTGTFSRQFIEGMNFTYPDPGDPKTIIRERPQLLGDTQRNDPGNWHWGSGEKWVDCVLMLYAECSNDLQVLINDAYEKIKSGVELIHMGEDFEYDPKKISKEHFGFSDGISQPIIKGLSKSKKELSGDNLLNPGEFILGYKNEYGHYSPSPYVSSNPGEHTLPPLPGAEHKWDLGKNGTYLVFRQMEQHVEAFWRFHYQHSKEAAVTREEKAVKLGAKMIGRWPDGHPLVTCPSGTCDPGMESLNDFNYTASDKDGVKCPLGAHIRRTNPRDQVHTGRSPQDSLVMSRRHRMLRRGRIYGPPLVPDMDIEKILCLVRNTPAPHNRDDVHTQTPIVRGLHFICLVSDIERQFEFVQNVWANTSTFANLCNEVDPIISPRPPEGQPDCHDFTTPQQTIRKRYTNVPQFTTIVGGAYFFLPGIRALNYMMSETSKINV